MDYTCVKCGATVAVITDDAGNTAIIRPCVSDCNEPVTVDIKATVYGKNKTLNEN
jgi:DNA-directed RNA polymerase subunit RPC12/RpoP